MVTVWSTKNQIHIGILDDMEGLSDLHIIDIDEDVMADIDSRWFEIRIGVIRIDVPANLSIDGDLELIETAFRHNVDLRAIIQGGVDCNPVIQGGLRMA